MKAEIISIGAELLAGDIADTNAQYLAQQLPAFGIDLLFVSQVGDDLEGAAGVFRNALGRSDLVIATGGLGPTADDITREAIAAAMGEQMEIQPELERELRALFERRHRHMPPQNLKQATTIPSSRPISNPIGSAPGWWVETGRRVLVAMPGVPHEMRHMWEHEVAPQLAARRTHAPTVSRTLRLAGTGESHVEEALGDLVRSQNPTLATYVKPDGIELKLTAHSTGAADADALLDTLEARVAERVGRWLYGRDNDTLSEAVGRLLTDRGMSLAVAESATGGNLAGLITDAAGASDYFLAGYVVYSPAAKQALGVPAGIIDLYGTISPETTRAVATAARKEAGATVAVATTGVAGPDDAEGQPAGTLHVAVDLGGHLATTTVCFRTSRADYKRRAAGEALYRLWNVLRDGTPVD